jgi:phosphoinositide-3-kinase regulatory subunit 4
MTRGELQAYADSQDQGSLASSLSSSRFLKTILARHAYGPLVLKIFIKPDTTMSLRPIQRRLKGQLAQSRDADGS